MENWTLDNFYIVGLAMLKIAYNFWPVILVVVAYVIWETFVYNPKLVRAKSKITKTSDRESQYSRDSAQQSGRRHL